MSVVKTLNNNLLLRSGCSYNPAFGENLFHLVCRLNIKSLIELVWKIAEKVFKNEAKDYFFIRNMFNDKKNAFDFAFEISTQSLMILSTSGYLLYDSDNFKSIDELRSSTRTNATAFAWLKNKTDVLNDENYPATSI